MVQTSSLNTINFLLIAFLATVFLVLCGDVFHCSPRGLVEVILNVQALVLRPFFIFLQPCQVWVSLHLSQVVGSMKGLVNTGCFYG